ncbi:hypothetical protein Mal64_27010 [Pseudobythopirellula maris]|uniref:Uncharacterized protein n=1 Tax=Pseudobythopirellula maris TaxID=2527991 RepID=A0A5C5ZIU0_9BACT|nr:hypothetical protein Mal64_27010 [Pseudobythopirellula maris]
MFKMVPAKWRKDGDKRVVDRVAFGVAYSVTEDGDFEEIWRTEGWYAFEGYLSDDGRYFVRVGPWASDQEKHTDLAIAFYKDGKLLKSYEVRELIQQPELLEMSVSHYTWRPWNQSKPNGFYDAAFHLVMIDKTAYTFDYETGKITVRARDEQAKSEGESLEEERAIDAKRGRELLQASDLSETLALHFRTEEVELNRGSFYGCPLEGPIWSATLFPKRPYAHDVSVSVLCEIRGGRQIVFPLTPSQITAAIEKAFAHSFVTNRFADDATGIRLRMQGGRLHWNTPELVDFIEKTSGARPKEDSLNHWAYFIIDGKETRHTSIYLNTNTGDLIAEDKSAWPWRPFLVDENGVPKAENESEHELPEQATRNTDQP